MASMRRQCRRRKGMMTVEAALLFPLLLLLLFGVIEYGWVLLKTQQITNAARHGARMAVVADANNDEVALGVAQLMTAVNISGYQLTLPVDVGAFAPGETLTVRISVPIENVQLAGPTFVPVPSVLAASVTMVKEGP